MDDDTAARREARRRFLTGLGAADGAAEELLAYSDGTLAVGAAEAPPAWPLDDDPHLAAWREYREEAERTGTVAALGKRLVQLRFPIADRISASETYRRATRRGIFPAAGAPGLELRRPRTVELRIHPTPAGAIPVVTAGERSDFVTLVQALAARNEPVDVPGSMGACIVRGLVNWDRVARYRRSWESRQAVTDGAAWAREMARLRQRPELYQDRLILLSRGAYSGVPSTAAGLSEDEWQERSLVLRLEHEVSHYLTLRALGSMQSHLHDELIADYAGLVAAFGRYRRDLALLFLGLESFPRYRRGGRLENYRGKPPLSGTAFEVLGRVVHACTASLERFDAGLTEADRRPEGRARTILALSRLHLEELAARS